VAGYAASLAIVAVVAVQAGDDLDPASLELWPLPLALVLIAVWWLLLASGWGLLVAGTVRRSDIGTWCRTQALRYLPGGLWAPASRVVVVRGRMLDKFATVAAENVIALCAALALGGIALAASGEPAWAAVGLVLAVPAVASRFLASRTRVAPERVVPATAVYAAAFAAYAVAAVLVQGAVSGFDDSLAVAGAALVAWGAGLVVVIAPGGVGVREAAYVGLLAGSSLSDGDLAAAAVTLRVLTVFAEVGVLLVAARPVPGPAPG
jgi:glycosyltransferase 2 family protein